MYIDEPTPSDPEQWWVQMDRDQQYQEEMSDRHISAYEEYMAVKCSTPFIVYIWGEWSRVRAFCLGAIEFDVPFDVSMEISLLFDIAMIREGRK